MNYHHTSVLYRETLDGLQIRESGVYVDGTLGGGGHASGILERLGRNGVFIGIDRDADAIRTSAEKLSRFDCEKHFIHSNYTEIRSVLTGLEIERIDGAILDLGVSSFQLDNIKRGFSYMQDAPLDMRMDAGSGLTAEEVVNTYDETELTRILRTYGEERWASRISAFIVRERRKKKIESTEELVGIVKAAIPAAARRDGPHPAKRTFQAIRIEVNGELSGLERAVEDFIDVLAPGGRLCIISFHSLEDRIVKEAFARRENPCTCPKSLPQCICGKKADGRRVTRKPVTAGSQELGENPRSRSAKLRVLEKLLPAD